ncbi:MAG: septation protein IspZ, partial [Hyphomicrobium denitrificans]|nr:septation protein IspZ [Hyphomicrobium denitrificans]
MSDENKVVAAENAQLFDRKQLIKLVVEFGPLLVFFVANSRYGIYTGTGAFMVATVVSLIASRTLLGRIAVMPLITSVFV